MKYTFSLITLGCSKNTVDSENIASLLLEEGHTYTSILECANIVIINTCSFILDAKKESIDTILSVGELKKQKDLVIIVMGCLSQRYKEELLSLLPEIDYLVGTGELERISFIFSELSARKTPSQNQIGSVQKQYLENTGRHKYFCSHYRYIKISEGCNNHCSYCIIPSLRGAYKSRSIESIEKEARLLVY